MRILLPQALLAFCLTTAGPAAGAASRETAEPCPPPASAEGIACLEAEVRALLQAWVLAWAEADVETFLGLYDRPAPDAGDTLREARDAERRASLRSQEDVVVTLDLESMGIGEGGRVDVIFVQHYRSATRTSTLRKQLFLIRRDGALKIRREVVLD